MNNRFLIVAVLLGVILGSPVGYYFAVCGEYNLTHENTQFNSTIRIHIVVKDAFGFRRVNFNMVCQVESIMYFPTYSIHAYSMAPCQIQMGQAYLVWVFTVDYTLTVRFTSALGNFTETFHVGNETATPSQAA